MKEDVFTDKYTNDRYTNNSNNSGRQQLDDIYSKVIDDNNNSNNSSSDDNDIDREDMKREQLKEGNVIILQQEAEKLRQNHALMWMVSLLSGMKTGSFFATFHFIGFNGIIGGAVDGTLFKPGYLTSSIRHSMRYGFEVGTFVFFYNGFANSSRIIRKNDDSINHFVSGFAAGTLTSSLLGFSAYEKQSSNSTTTIVLKSDSSGVFKQYKPRSFKHAKYGLMLGTITMLWHMFVNSKPPPPKSQNISN